VLREKIRAAGLEPSVELDSAGTHGYHSGEPPDPRSRTAAARRGYDLSGLRARRVREADFIRFDLILAMDRDNLALLKKACPLDQQHRLGLFLDHRRRFADEEVPDPYYGGPDGFERVLDLLEDAADGLIESLRRQRP
jgi:protein-tyrosine phosphatase